jgi:hypothetical protein
VAEVKRACVSSDGTGRSRAWKDYRQLAIAHCTVILPAMPAPWWGSQ